MGSWTPLIFTSQYLKDRERGGMGESKRGGEGLFRRVSCMRQSRVTFGVQCKGPKEQQHDISTLKWGGRCEGFLSMRRRRDSLVGEERARDIVNLDVSHRAMYLGKPARWEWHGRRARVSVRPLALHTFTHDGSQILTRVARSQASRPGEKTNIFFHR